MTFRFTEEELRTRAEWAEIKGYRSWDEFLRAVEEGFESILPYRDWYMAEHASPTVKGFKTVGEALKDIGVSSMPAEEPF